MPAAQISISLLVAVVAPLRRTAAADQPSKQESAWRGNEQLGCESMSISER
jgi:hypothetical protein